MAEKVRDYPIYKELLDAYDFYNNELFKGKLPECIITLNKGTKSLGIFYPLNFISTTNPNVKLHEISMNVQMFIIRQIELTLSTVVHEMCHLKTYEDGEYGRGYYHNRVWADLMISVGLIPTVTGREGGRQTGQQMTHYIEKGGIFEEKTKKLIETGYLLPFVEQLRETLNSYSYSELEKKAIAGKPGFYKDENGDEFKGEVIKSGIDEKGEDVYKVIVKETPKAYKVSYECSCGQKVWGKPGLDITCNGCKKKFLAKEEVN